jgi:hypothetical protein
MAQEEASPSHFYRRVANFLPICIRFADGEVSLIIFS